MDKKFFWESWRLANRSSDSIRSVLTVAVMAYFLDNDHALKNFGCFGLDLALTCIGLMMVFVLFIKQYKMSELDEQYYAKGVERAQKQDAKEQDWQKEWHRIAREMSAIEEENGNNLKILKRLLFGVYIIAGISVIMSSICIRCFPS